MMTMTVAQSIITIAMCVLGTMATRFVPFLIFKEDQPTPKFVQYLGEALPAAVFAMLVVYSLKDVTLFSGDHGVPEIIGILATVGVHLWRHSMLLSIFVGTAVYMVMVQCVFA